MPPEMDSPSSEAQLAASLETIARLERQLREAQKMEAMGLLAGGIAHDFNNLLTVINGYSEMLLATGELPQQEREVLAIIRDAGTRAAALAEGLLAFSRRKPIDPCILDLNQSVGEVASLVNRLLPVNIRCSTVLAPDLKMVLADSGCMQQAILNLVVNSRDAMPGGGTIEIRTANLTIAAASTGTHPNLPAGCYVLLSVADTGAGMDAETKRHLFEPFYTTKAYGSGTGLGLPMVQHIVKQSGGFISVESDKGRGTTVRIYLPAAASEKTEKIPGSRVTAPGGRETILLVENAPEVRALLSKALEDLGYTILAAASAGEAEALARGLAGHLDLLVADVLLEDSTGDELARRLRESRPRLRALFISGYTQGAAIERVQKSGWEFLSKPFSVVALADRIRSILDRRTRHRILFVDDDHAVVQFADRVLRDAGFEVLVAYHGNAALATVETEHVDLVITDLVMPEREGLETIMTLRKRHRSLPVIAISGASGGQFLKAAASLGACATLAKPFSGQELLGVVRAALGTE
jgi:CheY-like chemotaxis protein